jgi:spermidine/putrescine transport system ATP-binding protein
LAMIAGFEFPTEGHILLDGNDVTTQPPFLRDVNTVFQSYALFPHMTVFENVAFGLRVEKTPKAELNRRVEEALAMVQMQNFGRRLPKQLSGGQQQRVALARALVLCPQVLLLDEPLGALDFKLRKEMQVELKRLQQKLGVTFVFVTHDQEEALTMSDRIAVMNKGRIEQIGTPTEIYERPSTRFVAEFIGETNLLDAQVLKRSGDTVLLNVGGLHLNLPAVEVPQSSAVVVSVRPERVTLAAPGELAVTATVTDRIYMGSAVKLIARTADGLQLVATGAPVTALGLLAPGETVRLRWAPSDCVTLEAGEVVGG